ncbi:MAG TPA: LPS export ABC transporter periplasmic protein LptC, partial [Fibrobacteria bacterium]|nr:LPS export ABC transporter periplasmic protein LptC [Fibrobacteria bacterium]
MLFIMVPLAFLAGGCAEIGKESEGKPGGPHKDLPLSEYKDSVVLDMYEGSRKSWVLRTRHLVKWPRTDLVKATPVDLMVFDSLGAQVVKVTADSGSVDEAINFLAATGRVHAHSAKGVDIRTDSLRWNKTLNQIHTEARVRVISEEGDTLTGRGFLSDAKLDNWQILADVKGVFQKVEERFQEADKPADSTAAPAAVRTDSTTAAQASGGSAPAALPADS